MPQKVNHKQMAADIVRLVGGPENVQSLGHCMTRLRFILKDESKANPEDIKKIKGVLGVISAGGQFMVILGANLLPVFEAAQKDFNLTHGNVTDENLGSGKKEPLTVKSALMGVLGFVSASVTPLVAGLIAGGMLKVVLVLINMRFDITGTGAYALLSAVADAPFYFMPIFVAYGAAIKLGATPLYAMACAAALLHSNYTAMVAAGDPVSFFGLPVRLMGYSSSLLPALLLSLCAYFVEKGLNKIVPGIFKSILVGMGTISITTFLGFTILAPLGGYLSKYLGMVFTFLSDAIGPASLAVLAGCLPWIIMCGMHTSFGAFMTQSLASPGYDGLFRPALLLHNMAEGGACLGVAMRTKDSALRSEALSIAFGCVVAGVSEPAIYGINLPRKKPLFGVMAGGAAGGFIAGLFGCRVFVMGYSTILALPLFEGTVLAMTGAIVVAIIVAAVVTFIICPEISKEGQEVEAAPSTTALKAADKRIVAPVDGKMIDITTVKDETFATKVLGEGVAFEMKGDMVVSPVTGTLSNLADTYHAFGVTRPDGLELLVHIGIDTVSMNGTGFTSLVHLGDNVKAGQPIIRVDVDLLKSKGYDLTTMLIITDGANQMVSFKPYGTVSRGDTVNR